MTLFVQEKRINVNNNLRKTIMNKTIVALYDDLGNAQRAVEKLVSSGYSRDSISLMANDTSNTYSKYLNTPTSETPVHTADAVTAGEGAGFGATVGALTGIVVGLGAFVIPGIGPVLGAGPLAAGLGALAGGVVGAVAGGATGGVVAGLVKTGVSPADAEYFAEGVRRGGTLVLVHTTDTDASRAQGILREYSPVDIDQHGEAWKKSGWKGYDASAEPYTTDQINDYRTTAKVDRGTLTNTPIREHVYDVPEDTKDKHVL
jgi:hypothetical protein